MKKLGSDKQVKVAAGFGGEEDAAASSAPGQGTFMNVPVELLNPNPYQPRLIFNQEELESLAESIRVVGILLPVCIFIEKGRYFIGDGERRWRASKLAGKTTLPCFVTTGNPAEVALIGNMQRADLKPIEEAEAYARMQKEFGYTHKGLAQVLGRSRNNITETLSLNKLPDHMKSECLRVDIAKRKLIAIARKKTTEEMEEAFNRIMGKESPYKLVFKPSKVSLACSQVEKITETIEKLSLADYSQDDSGAYIDALRKLKAEIEKLPTLAPRSDATVSVDDVLSLGDALYLCGSARVKLLRKGFRIFRARDLEKTINELQSTGGWTLISRHDTKKAMNEAMKEILNDPMAIQD